MCEIISCKEAGGMPLSLRIEWKQKEPMAIVNEDGRTFFIKPLDKGEEHANHCEIFQ